MHILLQFWLILTRRFTQKKGCTLCPVFLIGLLTALPKRLSINCLVFLLRNFVALFRNFQLQLAGLSLQAGQTREFEGPQVKGGPRDKAVFSPVQLICHLHYKKHIGKRYKKFKGYCQHLKTIQEKQDYKKEQMPHKILQTKIVKSNK